MPVNMRFSIRSMGALRELRGSAPWPGVLSSHARAYQHSDRVARESWQVSNTLFSVAVSSLVLCPAKVPSLLGLHRFPALSPHVEIACSAWLPSPCDVAWKFSPGRQ